jgi:hypothetical protein
MPKFAHGNSEIHIPAGDYFHGLSNDLGILHADLPIVNRLE